MAKSAVVKGREPSASRPSAPAASLPTSEKTRNSSVDIFPERLVCRYKPPRREGVLCASSFSLCSLSRSEGWREGKAGNPFSVSKTTVCFSRRCQQKTRTGPRSAWGTFVASERWRYFTPKKVVRGSQALDLVFEVGQIPPSSLCAPVVGFGFLHVLPCVSSAPSASAHARLWTNTNLRTQRRQQSRRCLQGSG